MKTSAYQKAGSAIALLAGGASLAWLWQRLKKAQITNAPAAAFAGEGAHIGSFVHTRDAGPEHIRDEDGEDWDRTDQASDESFPSSDPPAHNDFRTPEPIDYSKD